MALAQARPGTARPLWVAGAALFASLMSADLPTPL